MLTELHGKAGRICQSALDGQLRCPLIVRPTSEDVVTGHLCQVLRALNSRWWLPDLLNLAVGVLSVPPAIPSELEDRTLAKPAKVSPRITALGRRFNPGGSDIPVGQSAHHGLYGDEVRF